MPKILIGSLVVLIAIGQVLFSFSEPIHMAFVFFLFSLRPEFFPNSFKTDMFSLNELTSLHIRVITVKRMTMVMV